MSRLVRDVESLFAERCFGRCLHAFDDSMGGPLVGPGQHRPYCPRITFEDGLHASVSEITHPTIGLDPLALTP